MSTHRMLYILVLTVLLSSVTLLPHSSPRSFVGATSPQQNSNRIILSEDSLVSASGYLQPQTYCTGDFGLYSPDYQTVYYNYKYQIMVPIEVGQYAAGTELVFFINPCEPVCTCDTYLSTDPDHAIITQVDATTYRIAWEDWDDADFDDLVTTITLQPIKMPFLDLPFGYAGSTFANESRDTEQDGKVNAYLDHQYPTYNSSPNAPSYPNTVNFYGYDSSQTDPPPPYNVAYNGHDGIDYYLVHNTPVLAAADGVVTFAGEKPLPCDVNGPSKTIIISHANGYETQYWHLDHFAAGLRVGSEVTRDAEEPIGYVGNTGCIYVPPGHNPATSGYHLHFMVKNAEGIVVDPYGWDPLPDAAWYGQIDPWQQYHSDQDDHDATSHYLWIHPLRVAAVTDSPASIVITSTSGRTRATIPANVYGAPLRMELAEGLQTVHIPEYQNLYTFSLFGYTADDTPVTTLEANVTLDIQVSAEETRALATGVVTPTLRVWDSQQSAWQELPITWDPATGIAHASSSQIGTFALLAHKYFIYLPLVLKASH